MIRHRVQRPASRGFTLVEALVALIVLSIGLLGVAGMQIAGLRANMSASSRTQASYLADDIVDRMRANNTAARGGSYNVLLGATLAGSTTAQQDVQTWVTELQSLPAGQGSINVDPATNIATIIIQWVDSRGGDTSACTGANLDTCSPISFTTVTQL